MSAGGATATGVDEGHEQKALDHVRQRPASDALQPGSESNAFDVLLEAVYVAGEAGSRGHGEPLVAEQAASLERAHAEGGFGRVMVTAAGPFLAMPTSRL